MKVMKVLGATQYGQQEPPPPSDGQSFDTPQREQPSWEGSGGTTTSYQSPYTQDAQHAQFYQSNTTNPYAQPDPFPPPPQQTTPPPPTPPMPPSLPPTPQPMPPQTQPPPQTWPNPYPPPPQAQPITQANIPPGHFALFGRIFPTWWLWLGAGGLGLGFLLLAFAAGRRRTPSV